MCKHNAASDALAEHLKFRPQGLRSPAERTGFIAFTLSTTATDRPGDVVIAPSETDPMKLSPFAKKLANGLADHEVVTLSAIGVAIQQETVSVADSKVLSKAAPRTTVRVKAGGKLVFERTLAELLTGGPTAALTSDTDAGTNVLRKPPEAIEYAPLAGAFHMSKGDKLEIEMDYPGATVAAPAAAVTLIFTVKGIESSGR